MSRKPRHPYPDLTDSGRIPILSAVWGVWRWLGHNEPPGDCWWFTMERDRASARKYANSLWRWQKKMGYPRPRVEKVYL